MSNFNKYLKNNEDLIKVIHPVKIFLYIKIFLSILIFLIPFFFMIPLLNMGFKGLIFALLIIFLSSLYFFISYNKWLYNCLILTKNKIYRFYYHSLFSRFIKEFYLDNIDEINIEYPNFLSKVLSIGDIVIYLKNNKFVDLNNVYQIKKIKNIILELKS